MRVQMFKHRFPRVCVSSVREVEASFRVRDQYENIRRKVERNQGGHLLDGSWKYRHRDNGVGFAHTNVPVRAVRSQRPTRPNADNDRDMIFIFLFFSTYR